MFTGHWPWALLLLPFLPAIPCVLFIERAGKCDCLIINQVGKVHCVPRQTPGRRNIPWRGQMRVSHQNQKGINSASAWLHHCWSISSAQELQMSERQSTRKPKAHCQETASICVNVVWSLFKCSRRDSQPSVFPRCLLRSLFLITWNTTDLSAHLKSEMLWGFVAFSVGRWHCTKQKVHLVGNKHDLWLLSCLRPSACTRLEV